MPRTHKSLPRLYVEQTLAAGASLTLEREQIGRASCRERV